MRLAMMMIAALAACGEPQISRAAAPLDADDWEVSPPAASESGGCPTIASVTEIPWVRPLPIVAVGDMRGQYVRLLISEVNADPEHPVTYVRFRLHEIYRCGEHLVPWHPTNLDLCDVVACETLRVSWYNYAPSENDGVVDGTLRYADATPLPYWVGEGPDDDMSDVAFFTEQLIGMDRPQLWLTVVAQVRDDAPGGRFQLWLRDMRWGDYGSLDPFDRDIASHHHLHGLPIFGTDFTTGTMVEFPDCASDTVSAVAGPEGF